jgi:hypothetical protein
MASLNNNNRKREVHNRTSLTYRKGKQRLRPLSVKQLTSKLESAQSNRLKDAIGKELARRTRMGIFSYNPPASTEK